MTWTRWTLLLATLITLGCNGSSTKRYHQDQRVLNLGILTGDVQSSTSAADWSLINERKFSLTACLQDGARFLSVGSGHWTVTAKGMSVDADSGANGCLTWPETVDFEPGVQPIYIPYERTIVSRDGRFDPMVIHFRLNPWTRLTGNEPGFNDPRFAQSDVKVAAAAQADQALSHGASTAGSLFVTILNFAFTGSSAALTLDFQPQLRTHYMDGGVATIGIDSGRVTVRAQILFAEKDGGALKPLSGLIVKTGVGFSQQQVHLENLDLPNLQSLPKDHGIYYISLQVVPENGPPSVESFNKIFLVGTYAQLGVGGPVQAASNSDSLKVDAPAPPSAKPVGALGGAKGNGGWNKWLQPTAPSTGVTYSLGSIYPSMDHLLDENTLYRRVSLKLSAEVINNNPNGKSLVGEWFEIAPMDNPTGKPYLVQVQLVNGRPHLEWIDTIVHNYYEPVHTLYRSIQFKRQANGEVITEQADLKPWVRYIALFVDEATLADPNRPHGVDAPKNFILRFESPCFAQDQRTYSVNPVSMDLKMQMPILFSFSPTIRRMDQPVFGMSSSPETLLPGYYLLTMVAYNLDVKDTFKNPISVAQRVVLYTGGKLVAQVDLALNDLSFARLRNFVALDIQVLDPATLRGADGQLVDPAVAYSQSLPVVSGDIVPRARLGMAVPPQIFPFTPSADDCQSANGAQNFDDPKLQEMVKQIQSNQLDLLQVAKDWKAQQAVGVITPAQQTQWEQQGWKDAAKQWGLRPYEINSDADTLQLGYEQKITTQELQTALECMYEVNEQDDEMPAKCQYTIGAPMWKFCQAMGLYWMNAAAQNAWAKGDTHPGLLNAITAHMFPHCFNKNETRKYMRVRKYVHPYQLAQTENLKLIGGFVSDLTVRDGLTIGTDYGSELMKEDSVAFAMSLGLKGSSQNAAKFLPVLKGITSFMNQVTGARDDDTVAAKMSQTFGAAVYGLSGLSLGGGTVTSTSVGIDRSHQNFRWAFNYNIPYNFINLTTSSTLTTEEVVLPLDILRSRTCYSIEPDMASDDWDGLMMSGDYATGFRPRLYVCFPTNNDHQQILEHYFAVYNNPGSGAMVDNGLAQSRWFMMFRGQRDYGVFMEGLRGQFELIHRGEKAPEPIMTAIGNLRGKKANPLKDSDGPFLLDRPNYPGVVSAPHPSDGKFDTWENLEGPYNFDARWVCQNFNPWCGYGESQLRDQNNAENRVFSKQ